ncbi:MAG: dockerin type I domain-containing protein [Aureliella sp.]
MQKKGSGLFSEQSLPSSALSASPRLKTGEPEAAAMQKKSPDPFSFGDSESLVLSLDVGAISEKNGVVSAAVARSNTDTTEPVEVLLAVDDSTEATIPISVIIPAGQSQVPFLVHAVNDSAVDGNQVIHVSAMAVGYETATAALVVTDDDRTYPWQNPRNPLDVNDDGFITAIDALLVINALNVHFELPPEPPDPFIPASYMDVNGDAFITAIDALYVINAINSVGQGESVLTPATSLPESDPAAWAFDAAVDLLVKDRLNQRRWR